MPFVPATKSQARARIGISGPAGSGKTFSALRIATALGGRIALIDTEHGSANKYADRFQFDQQALASFHPLQYVTAIEEAAAASYDVLIIDSASHEWNGLDGCLELVDKFQAKYKGNQHAAWKDVTPLHNRFIEAILAAPLHVIVTFRSKMDYIQIDSGNGKREVRKVGMAPITREGAEYELDIVGELDLQHRMVITKSRCDALADQIIDRPGEEFAAVVKTWLSDGGAPPPPPCTDEQLKAMWQAAQDHEPALDVAGLTAFANELLRKTYANPRALNQDEATRVLLALASASSSAQEAAG